MIGNVELASNHLEATIAPKSIHEFRVRSTASTHNLDSPLLRVLADAIRRGLSWAHSDVVQPKRSGSILARQPRW